MLLPDLARRIVREVKRLLDEPIIITDVDGRIMAGTDASRIGAVHEGALLASRTKQSVVVDSLREAQWRGVREGISLPLLFRGEVVGVVGITGKPDRVARYAELVRKMTELLVHEHYYLEQLEYEQRGYEALLVDWLRGGERTAPFADRAKALGVDLNRPKRLALISFGLDGGEMLPRALWQQVRALLRREDVLARWGDDRLLLVFDEAKPQPPQELLPRLRRIEAECARWVRAPIRIGVGKRLPAHELHRSYEQAAHAASLADGGAGSGIAFYEELRLEMCLQDITPQTRRDYLERTIAPLISEPDLMETLRALIGANVSYKLAADRLHVHINTLQYRLRKIADLTGLDPKRFEDLAELHLAMKLLSKETKS
ncbi:diguanylate cyclase [Paenibacillus thermoaerophilus]|nr:diguanylate cyclase [Paenibacillus thermoaerophilus]